MAANRAARATPAPTPLDAAPAVTTGGRVAVVVPLLGGNVLVGLPVVRVDRVAGVVGTGGTTTEEVLGLLDGTTGAGGVATGVVWTGGGTTGGVAVTTGGTGWVSVTGQSVVETATVTVVYCSPGQSVMSGAQDVMVCVDVAKMVEYVICWPPPPPPPWVLVLCP